jgi:hypothetical protein
MPELDVCSVEESSFCAYHLLRCIVPALGCEISLSLYFDGNTERRSRDWPYIDRVLEQMI